jgi:hypothetical protein
MSRASRTLLVTRRDERGLIGPAPVAGDPAGGLGRHGRAVGGHLAERLIRGSFARRLDALVAR